jgi:hypothetical protein
MFGARNVPVPRAALRMNERRVSVYFLDEGMGVSFLERLCTGERLPCNIAVLKSNLVCRFRRHSIGPC